MMEDDDDDIEDAQGRLVVALKTQISVELERQGYAVQKTVGGPIWCNALRVDSMAEMDGTKCALLHLENFGESKKEWEKIFDEQLALERASQKCLRVDCLSTLLNFGKVVKGVLAFLEKNGLPTQNTTTNRKRKASEILIDDDDEETESKKPKATAKKMKID